MIRNTKRIFFAVLFLCPIGQSKSLLADDQPKGSLRFDYWTYGVSGDASVKGSQTHIKNTNKTLKGENWGVNMGGDLRFEEWGANMDLFISRQSNSQQISASQSATWEANYAILTAGAYLPFVDHEFEGTDRKIELDGFAGIRSYANNYKIQFNPFDPVNNMDKSNYVNWVDPYLGLRIQGKLSSSLALALYGDAGGFSIGHASELSVLTHADLLWTVTRGLNVIGGYRLFDLKTARDHGDQKTELDMRMAGPTLGLEVTF